MATYDNLFDTLGLRGWCGESSGGGLSSMADLMGQAGGNEDTTLWDTPFPSLDALHDSCDAIPQSRALTQGLEQGFLGIKDSLKVVVDPLTQPLSWALEDALWIMQTVPWFIMIPLLMLITYVVGRSMKLVEVRRRKSSETAERTRANAGWLCKRGRYTRASVAASAVPEGCPEARKFWASVTPS